MLLGSETEKLPLVKVFAFNVLLLKLWELPCLEPNAGHSELNGALMVALELIHSAPLSFPDSFFRSKVRPLDLTFCLSNLILFGK
ncbi:hypothetical protein G4B88_029666 [Cannabis sativa]|uniref:Uncharacterized protein n=1 Tax=Cannabis sativa TaxID=3483 RepID=A0A7J6EXR8_CANSA|nr:hypothetical protein G4B88_029666 [Cannabis sativa]